MAEQAAHAEPPGDSARMTSRPWAVSGSGRPKRSGTPASVEQAGPHRWDGEVRARVGTVGDHDLVAADP